VSLRGTDFFGDEVRRRSTQRAPPECKAILRGKFSWNQRKVRSREPCYYPQERLARTKEYTSKWLIQDWTSLVERR
jgi:hypothetical protein